MPESFEAQLKQYLSRSGVSDSELARTLGVSRQTIFRWKEGKTARPRHREDVLQLAHKLRLTEWETSALLLAAGFSPDNALITELPPANQPAVTVEPVPATPAPPPAPKNRIRWRYWLLGGCLLAVGIAWLVIWWRNPSLSAPTTPPVTASLPIVVACPPLQDALEQAIQREFSTQRIRVTQHVTLQVNCPSASPLQVQWQQTNATADSLPFTRTHLLQQGWDVPTPDGIDVATRLAQVSMGQWLLLQGQADSAASALAVAWQQQPTQPTRTDLWSQVQVVLCLHNSLTRETEWVPIFCTPELLTVFPELAPYRSLTLAGLGDFAGAAAILPADSQWRLALLRGENPFSAAVLAQLRADFAR